jgi:hypothetical protein
LEAVTSCTLAVASAGASPASWHLDSHLMRPSAASLEVQASYLRPAGMCSLALPLLYPPLTRLPSLYCPSLQDQHLPYVLLGKVLCECPCCTAVLLLLLQEMQGNGSSTQRTWQAARLRSRSAATPCMPTQRSSLSPPPNGAFAAGKAAGVSAPWSSRSRSLPTLLLSSKQVPHMKRGSSIVSSTSITAYQVGVGGGGGA